ncbi:hypothetical protein ACH5RR_018581 [Cinchona calisaya]|uniref:Uncharacterized protein n=1 Tax=Cinchona calisaya TaxID=153742 RepID=A0ABD2ZPP9_9GENT
MGSSKGSYYLVRENDTFHFSVKLLSSAMVVLVYFVGYLLFFNLYFVLQILQNFRTHITKHSKLPKVSIPKGTSSRNGTFIMHGLWSKMHGPLVVVSILSNS